MYKPPLYDIVVAEDHGATRDRLVARLSIDGYMVVGAENGFEALREIEPIVRMGRKLIVVTDTQMPIMDGEDLIGQLLIGNYPMPIVVVYSRHRPDPKLTDEYMAEGGVVEVLDKRDSDCDDVAEKVNELMRNPN